jgi:hypothetical protein
MINDYSISQQIDPLEEERKRKEEQDRLAALQSGLPVEAPISPEQIQQPPQIGQLPTPGEPTVVAGPTQPVSPTAPTMPMTPTKVEITPQARQEIQQQTTPFQQALTDSQNDQKKMWEIYTNSQYTPEQRQIAGAQLSDMMRQEYEKNKATQYIKTATPEDLNKMLNARSTEGNWGKAIMYGLLGMENSARDEAAKLGVGAKWQTQQVYDEKTGTTSNVLYKVRADGLPIEGYNAETGKSLSSKELSSLSGGTQKLNIVGGSYVNDKTGEVGRMVTDEKTGRTYVQTDTGRKPMAGFRPQSSTGTLEDMRGRAIQDLNIKLAGKTMEEKLAILRPYNQQLAAQGIQPVQPSEIGLQTQQVPQNLNQRPQALPAQQAPAQQAPAQQAPTIQPQAQALPGGGVKLTPPQRVPLEQQATVAPGPSPFSGVNPQLQATAGPSMPVAPITPTAGAGLGGRPTGADIEAQKTKQKEAAQEEGVDLGKLKVNQGKAETNADYLINKMDELVTHPGFSFSVGVANVGSVPLPGAGKIAGMIEGTDTSDWAARFNEIKGQSFLQAVENLRGMGSLSNQEGDAATKAIQRMSTSQSEKEFKAAATDFKEIIQRGIDRNREKLGQPAKYGTPSETESKLTTEDKKALEWANKNPNDPRSRQIKQRLGL